MRLMTPLGNLPFLLFVVLVGATGSDGRNSARPTFNCWQLERAA